MDEVVVIERGLYECVIGEGLEVRVFGGVGVWMERALIEPAVELGRLGVGMVLHGGVGEATGAISGNVTICFKRKGCAFACAGLPGAGP